jgi:hypothetical protein
MMEPRMALDASIVRTISQEFFLPTYVDLYYKLRLGLKLIESTNISNAISYWWTLLRLVRLSNAF